MKHLSALSIPIALALLAGAAACNKETKSKEVATVAQDTMLLHDLAEANKNTAAAEAADNSLTTVMTANDGVVPSTTSQMSQNRPETTVQPRPNPSESETSTPRTRPTVPTRASDAPAPTSVPLNRSPASGDPCDSPAAADQRACLNRYIVANDADLNRTYQELIAQARKSGGSDLEERIRQQQREWINERDADCRAESQSGRLWARGVARCLASYSDRRTVELRRTLSGLRGQ